jgi:hypothetical protein
MSRVLEHTYVDVRGPLRAMRGAVPMYWKTDSHWTPEGAYVAYEQLCLRLGITPRRDLLERPEVTADIPLDLGAAVVPRLTETFRMRSHVLEARRVFANEVVTFKEGTGRDNDAGLHVGSRVVYENGTPRAAPLRVMLFGDSFAEYRPTLLTGLLAETVERLDFVWSAEVDWDLVAAERPDVVVSELAERFHTTIPVDDGFALQRLERTVLAAAGPAS